MRLIPFLLFLSIANCTAAEVVVFTGARIHTVAGPVIENGVLVIADGKIVAVGDARTTPLAADATIHDVSGKTIIPGLVDSHSHLGVASRPHVPSNIDGNERTGAVQSIVRAIDSINALDPGIRMAQAGGVTTANIMPGSGNVIGGQTAYVKLRGDTIDEMLIEADGVLGGLKMANGENPKRYGQRNKEPMTRMKVAAMQRTEFMKARDYMRVWERFREKQAAGDEASRPDIDLRLEPLVEVLQGKRTVHFHTHRADDILTVLRLRREFGFELVIQHGTEGYKVLKQIAAARVPVSMTIVDSPGGKAEVVDFVESCGRELTEAGVPVHVNTDDPVTGSRFFLRTAAATLRGGLDPATALKAITLHPAQAMHLSHRVGSLEPGKDADFVILSGEPFSIYTRVLETWIDGNRVFDLSDNRQRLYQTGGFALAEPERVPAQETLVAALPRSNEAIRPDEAVPFKPANNTFVIRAGRVHTIAGDPQADSLIVVKDGRIASVVPGDQFDVYRDLPLLTATEVTPGLIDAHSVVPMSGEYNIPADQDGDEKTDPNQADIRVLDGFNPSERLLRFLLEQGVTVIHATPGHANVIGGLSGVFRTHGDSAEDMAIRFPQAMIFNLGVTPKKTYNDDAPGTRMGTASIIRNALTRAVNYASRKRAVEDKGEPGPDPDLKSEALFLALGGKVQSIFTAHRADDILTGLRLSGEFGLRPVLALGTEAYLVADHLKKRNVPVIAHPPMQRVGGIETYNTFLGNAAALSDAGLQIAICSSFEGYVPKTRVIRWEAAIGMTYGLGHARALKSITLDAAKILGIDRDYGSLEPGKIADLVLYDGDPFEHTTHVTHVFVGGKLVYERAKRLQQMRTADRRTVSCPEPGCCVGF